MKALRLFETHFLKKLCLHKYGTYLDQDEEEVKVFTPGGSKK
jgi:hypothetical protein